MKSRYIKKCFYVIRDIIFCVIFLYVAEIAGMMAGSLVYQIMPRQGISEYLYVVISTVAYIVFIYISMKLYEKRVLHKTPQKQTVLCVDCFRNLGILILVELFYIAFTVLLIVSVCSGYWAATSEAQKTLYLFRIFLDFGIGAGIAEEIVFRGTMFEALKKQLGVWGSVGVTSLIFSLLHITNMTMTGDVCVTLFFTMILGIILCLIRLKTGTILASIVFHILWNIIFFGVINIGAEENLYAAITYVTGTPLSELLPLITSMLLLFIITKIRLRKIVD